MKQLRFLLVVVIALWMRTYVSAAPAAPAPHDSYCGDSVCDDQGCDINGNNLPGDGCRENHSNCPSDCEEEGGGGYCSPSWVPVWDSNSHGVGAHEVDEWDGNYLVSCHLEGTVHVTFHDENECGDPDVEGCIFDLDWGGSYWAVNDGSNWLHAGYCCNLHYLCGEPEFCDV